MSAIQKIAVRARSVSQLELEMKVEAVTESATMAASPERASTQEPSAPNTAGKSVVRNMPIVDERFQSLFPAGTAGPLPSAFELSELFRQCLLVRALLSI